MATNISSFRPELLAACPGIPIPALDTQILKTIRDFCKHTQLWTVWLDMIPIVAYTHTYALSSSLGDIEAVERVEFNWKKINFYSEKESDVDSVNWRSVVATAAQGCIIDRDNNLRLIYTPTEDSDAYFSLSDLTFDATAKTITSVAGDFEANGLVADMVNIQGSSDNNGDFHIASISGTGNNVLTVYEDLTAEGPAASATFIRGGIRVKSVMKPLLTATTVEDFIYDDYEDTIILGTQARLMKMPRQPWSDMKMGFILQDLYETERGKGLARKISGKANTPSMVRGRKIV